MAAWVLLRHALPDGSWHYDWMVEDPVAPGGGLITFRVDAGVAWPPVRGFEAVRLSAHRRAYLTYEGAVSGGRGTVTRVARGECRVRTGDRAIGVDWDGRCATGRPVAAEGAEGRWRFEVVVGGLEDQPDSRILRGTETGDAGERSNR